MKVVRWFCVLAAFSLALAGPDGPAHPAAARPILPIASLLNFPLRFERNHGQTDQRVRYVAHGAGYAIFLTPDGATLSLRRSLGDARDNVQRAVVSMRIVGGRLDIEPLGSELREGASNYLLGNDRTRWIAGVEAYSRVHYPEVLPGVEAVYYATDQRRLEYDLVLAPGTDVKSVAIAFDGVDSIGIDREGGAVLRLHGGGEIVQPAPVAYQADAAGLRGRVAARYKLRGNALAFEVESFDRRRPLVIDPSFVYSTFLGGTGGDGAFGVAVDAAGSAYIIGNTSSTNFPTASPIQASLAGAPDVFVSKLNPQGSALLYSTYVGGSGLESAYGIAVDAAGEAVLTGITNSTDFPTFAPFQPSYGGGPGDGFVAKLNASGTAFVYSTYLGGSAGETALAVTVDGNGAAFVTGVTVSTNFPTKAPVQVCNPDCYPLGSSYLGAQWGEAFITKFNAAGSALVYSTLLGGSHYSGPGGGAQGLGIAVDSTGEAFVTGWTQWTDFTSPFVPAIQRSLPSPNTGSAFVAKINSDGTSLLYDTYLGGSNSGYGQAIALDAAGDAFVAGFTLATDFPVMSPFQASLHGAEDAFVAKLNAGGTALVYSTYLGGSGADEANAISVDSAGEAFVAGFTQSGNFPTVTPIQASYGGNEDAFISKLNAGGSALVYSTYLGGTGGESAYGIAVDGAGEAVLAGNTTSSDFPTASPLQPALRGNGNAFVAKISASNPPPVPASTPLALWLALGLLLISGYRMQKATP